MSFTGTKKAALLLMGLDPASATQLLKAAKPETATKILAELAYLNAAGVKKKEATAEPVREFFGMIKQNRGSAGDRFVRDMAEGALGRDKAKLLLGKIQDLVQDRDPFMTVRSLEPADLAKALHGESAPVAAMVLAELTPKKSGQLLSLLDEKVRVEALRGMAGGEEPSTEIRRKVADLVLSRLRSPALQSQNRRDDKLRKVAVLLRSLPGELRNSMVQAIVASDAATGKAVQEMMVTWEDIVSVADRSLQEMLRGVDSKKLALALIGAEADIVKKIRTNMSERACAMLDEETSLLSSPKAEDTAKAREALLVDLRELNANNMLNFVDNP